MKQTRFRLKQEHFQESRYALGNVHATLDQIKDALSMRCQSSLQKLGQISECAVLNSNACSGKGKTEIHVKALLLFAFLGEGGVVLFCFLFLFSFLRVCRSLLGALLCVHLAGSVRGALSVDAWSAVFVFLSDALVSLWVALGIRTAVGAERMNLDFLSFRFAIMLQDSKSLCRRQCPARVYSYFSPGHICGIQTVTRMSS